MSQTSTIKAHLQQMYKTSELSDLVLKLQNGKELKVHKFVLYSCHFFKAACESGFKESVENIITFPEDPPQALELLIMLIYDFSCDEAFSEMHCTDGVKGKGWNVVLLPQAFNLADKYGLRPQKQTLMEKLKCTLDNHSKTSLIAPNSWYWQLARHLYASEDNALEMRSVLLAALRKHSNDLAEHKEFVERKLAACPGLAVELALSGGIDGKGLKLSSGKT